MVRAAGLLLGASLFYLGALQTAGDADRGRELFRLRGCVVCHSVDGKGGGYAPDLARRIAREQPPLGMAAEMWNRGLIMLDMLRKKRLELPEVGEQDLADLYAYFYSARYFDRPGEAGRGKQLLREKGCLQCHSLNGAGGGQGPAVSEWPPVAEPIALVERMWNASSEMRQAMLRLKIGWPELTAQQVADLHAAATASAPRQPAGEIPPPTSQPGARLFGMRNCAGCHKGSHALGGRFSGYTLLELATLMWNRAPEMSRRTSLGYGELRQILAYLWTLQITQPAGSASRGQQCYRAKGCIRCHGKPLSGAPTLSGRHMDPFALMASLWRRGPRMRDKLRESNMSWPVLSIGELADLGAYLDREAPGSR